MYTHSRYLFDAEGHMWPVGQPEGQRTQRAHHDGLRDLDSLRGSSWRPRGQALGAKLTARGACLRGLQLQY